MVSESSKNCTQAQKHQIHTNPIPFLAKSLAHPCMTSGSPQIHKKNITARDHHDLVRFHRPHSDEKAQKKNMFDSPKSKIGHLTLQKLFGDRFEHKENSKLFPFVRKKKDSGSFPRRPPTSVAVAAIQRRAQ